MNETMICAVGNVATSPVYRDLASGPSARFRLAVTSRYWDREKGMWTDGHTNFFTVWARRQLAANAAASLSVGDPVVVQGRLKVRTEQRDGQQSRVSADLDAVTIGHDLARGTSAFRRSGRPEQPAATTTADERPEPTWETPPTDTAGPPATPAGTPVSPSGPRATPPPTAVAGPEPVVGAAPATAPTAPSAPSVPSAPPSAPATSSAPPGPMPTAAMASNC
ncbi:single-stranded DNA-binding protein [Streptomyces sp. bgisy022]|uniref:single-stranded DNA-binding protein n=1 Tax=Streptomyces sp. bgisy022 TaxID=3413769 RepID=UPI003D7451E2